jgi:aspartate-semialdehyde dehydrogenase
VGTTIALKALDDAFGLQKVSVCTFQSLSGRGDAMYPPELVTGNIYPVWNTKERTEVFIGNEICALVNLAPTNLSVRAHRVGVHIGHFVDVRVTVRCPELLTSVSGTLPMACKCSPRRPLLFPTGAPILPPAAHGDLQGDTQGEER